MFEFRKAIEPLRAYVPGRPIAEVQKNFGLENVVKLASNENPYGNSPEVEKAVLSSLTNVRETALYPDGHCTLLRSAVSSFYDVGGDNIVFGAGSDEIISMLAKILIDPLDEAITAKITFPQYETAVNSMGGITKTVEMQNHGYNLNAIIKEITAKTKIIFIANPNNPTGTYFDRQQQADFLAKVPKNIVVVFDEAYKEYVAADDFPDTIPQIAENPNVVVLRTFSKIYGLAGFRVGFAVCNPIIAEQLEKIRQPFNIGNLAQIAALAALADQKFVQNSHQLNRQIMEYTDQELRKMGLFSVPSQANFLMTDVARDSRTVFEKLMRCGYIIRPGAAFGMEKFLRITIGTKQEMQGFLAALQEILR
ncbi:MAG: histidinol-phosphate transaminase [Firmicutes bacterium]|nr:histidinol-phosphate transaminase [Bacillota bacterium]